MRITGSDRGAAQGRADVRLNGDRNEVEMINLDGRIGQQLYRQLQSRLVPRRKHGENVAQSLTNVFEIGSRARREG